jgi:two-component system, chemotaxis family, chemotaxis protein CheY
MKKVSVLIVDDSAVMRKIVERSLRQAGIEIEKVLEADSGATALSVIQQTVPDMIFSDVNMPTMDGIEFIRQLRSVESAKGVPVVMITTEGSQTRVMEALSLGAQGYIRKPFTPDQVRAQVVPLLEGK